MHVLGDSDREYADVLVLRQRDGFRAARKIELELEQIAILIELVARFWVMTVRAEPRNVAVFNVARHQAAELAANLRRLLGRFLIPQSIVPLADVAGPILNSRRLRLLANLKRR